MSTPRTFAALLNDRRAFLDPGAVGALAREWLAAATAQGLAPDVGLPSTVRVAVGGRLPGAALEVAMKEALQRYDRLRGEEMTKERAKGWARR